MKILVAEDEPQVSAFIKQGLQENGYEVDVAFDGQIAQQLALTRTYDVVLVDVVLPGVNGFELCKRLKAERPGLPILMLTTLATTADKLAGFDAGTDDYLTKPFEFDELLARLKVLTRRMSTIGNYGNLLRFEDLVLDLDKKVINRGSKAIKLSSKEFSLLEYFMRNPERVISKSELAAKVWNLNFDTGTNVVEVYISMLRNKIDRNQERKYLHTRIGLGYTLSKEE